MFEVRQIQPELAFDIRQMVLRPYQTAEDCRLDTDYENSAFHVGAFCQEKLVSVASFCTETHPDFPAEKQYRLRAMATLDEFRNLGAGGAVVHYGENLINEQGVSFLWCKGRVNVQGYYNKLGFRAHGEVFDYPPIGPHIIMYKFIKDLSRSL